MSFNEKKLGLVIRRCREHRKLSQEALAALSGLSRTHIGEIERGEVSLSVENLIRIAEALGLKTSELFHLYENGKQ